MTQNEKPQTIFKLLTGFIVCFLLILNQSHAQCGFQATCPNTNYLNFGMGSNGDAATIEYDNFVSIFHSTVVRTAYGSYETWGQRLANDGVNHLLSPTEINSVNFPALTGNILKASLGSDFITVGQGIVLTTTGLFAWSDPGAVLNSTITTGSVFQKLTIDGQSDGLPAGVDPLDIKMLFTTHGTMAIVTCSGDVYVITQNFNNTGNGHTVALTQAQQTQWHRVRQSTAGNPFLTNVIAVRGNRNTLFALKADGTLWTWGAETYLGNNTANASRNYATAMTLPSANAIKMIGVTRDNGSNRASYYVLNANGNLYGLGHNGRKQLGDWTTTERLQWVQPRYTSAAGPVMNNIHWISPNEHDPRYGAINVLNIDSTNYNWGDANGQMLGRGGTLTYDPGIPNGITTLDKILAVETGGHTSMLIKKCEDFFGYVGHRINGSMGDGTTNTTNEASYTFNTAVVYICGATTAEISLTGAPTFGNNGLYCNGSEVELITFPTGGQLSVLSGPGVLSNDTLSFTGTGNTTVTIRYIVSTPGCPVPDTAVIDLLTEDCYFPSWTLTKTATPATYSNVGDVINYQISLDNTGNVGIQSVVVTDAQATTGPTYVSGDVNSNSILDTTEIWIYQATKTINQLHLNNGSFTNTATASGTPIGGSLSDASDMETVTAVQSPSIQIEKTSFPIWVQNAGDTVTYSFMVTNTGNVTLSNVMVTDPLLGAAYGPATLQPDSVITYSHIFVVNQTVIDTGGIINEAYVQALDPGSNIISSMDKDTLEVLANPQIELNKTALPLMFNMVNENIVYTFQVTNTGNVTLTNVLIEDPLFGISFGPFTLLPDSQVVQTYNYQAQQFDLDIGSIFNEASASGDYDGNTYTDLDDETVMAEQLPSIQFVKSADTLNYGAIGDSIVYTFIITNNGNVTLSDIALDDDIISYSNSIPVLFPGESDTFTHTFFITQMSLDTGSIYNLATAHFNYDFKDYFVKDSVLVTAVQTPAIEIQKSTSSPTYSFEGENVTYTFVITNTGNVSLTNINIDDPLFGVQFGPVALAPGQNDTFTFEYTVTQAAIDSGYIENIVYIEGEDPSGNPVNDTDTLTITAIQNPASEVVKYALPASYDSLGQQIDFYVVITNTGNVTLDSVLVNDPLIGGAGTVYNLAPSVSDTMVFPYFVTQADLDSAHVFNTVYTASFFDGVSYPDTAVFDLPAIQNPSLSLTKTASQSTYSAINEAVTYSFEVVNTGNVTLHDIVVEDTLFSLSFGPVSLAPDSSVLFNYIYSVTQSALDTGSVFNTAFVEGSDPMNNVVNDSDTASISAIQNPSLSLQKTANPLIYDDQSDIIQYTFLVTNTGNVTLDSVEVVDSLFNIQYGPTTLAPGGTVQYQYNYSITLADLNNGSIYNLAMVFGKDPNDNVIDASDDETVTAIQSPSISIVKSANVASYSDTSDVVTYSFMVENTGNVTLTEIVVTDTLFSLNFGPVTLDPAARDTFYYEYHVSQAALDTGSIYNVAFVEGMDPNAIVVQDQDDETTNAIQLPSIQINKWAGQNTYQNVGENIEYSFEVINTGNVTLSDVNVVDTLFGLSFGPVVLLPGEKDTFTYTYLVNQAAIDTGSVDNIAWAHALDTNGNAINDSDTVAITAFQNPSIIVVKTADTLTYQNPGDSVVYSFIIENTGNVSLTNAQVYDSLFNVSFGPVDLSPGDVDTFYYTYYADQMAIDTGSVLNICSVSAFDTNNNEVGDTDDETITAVQLPSIHLTKVADPTEFNIHEQEIEFTFIVENTGNVSLTDVVVTDTLFGLVFGPISLSPGQTDTFSYIHMTTQAELDAGGIINIAEVSGLDPNGFDQRDTAQATVTAIQFNGIELDKSADPLVYNTAGDTITYTFVVTNTGNVTLTDVNVVDSLFNLFLGPVTLAPWRTETYTFQYPVTQVDLDGGSVYNFATVSGYDPNAQLVEDSDEVTIMAIQNPIIQLEKLSDISQFDSPGDTIHYSFIITNAGNVTLDNVVLVDPLFSIIYGPLTLAPGATDTSAYTYVTNQDDVDNGGIYNLATVFGDDPNDVQHSAQDDVFVPSVQSPSIQVIKSADTSQYDMAGDSIKYTFAVENTGNVTLTEVTIQDPLLGLFFGPLTLAPDSIGVYTYIHVINQMNVDTGSIVNIAYASAKDPNDNIIEDTDDETVTAIQNPSIALDKSADVANYDAVNDPIEYTFIVSNTGNVTLTNVTVDDPLFSLNFGPVDLAPGVSDTFTYTYLITQSDLDNGSIYNVADASGYDPNNVEINDSDEETVTAIQNPSIALDKSADVADYDAVNDPIEYTFIVSNTGNVTLTNVSVEDPLFSLNFGPVDLAPGVSDTFTYTYLVTQSDLDNGSIYNLADASGYDPNDVEINDSDEETVTAIQNPSIALDKSADVADYDAVNDPIEYTFIVSNTGNVTLTNVTVDDPLFSLNFGPVDLAPGVSDTFTYTYLVTQSDLDNGSIYNIADASGYDPNNVEINDSDDETVTAIQNPSIVLDKSADVSDYDAVIDPIEYTFIVSNTGNVTLTNVTVDDPLFSLNFGPVDLAPGVNDTFTYTYLVIQSDLDNGSIYNLADASGFDPNNIEINDSDDETVTAIQNPSIALDKSADVGDYDAVNDPIEYTFIVSNTGNVTLTNVTVDDPLFSLNFGPVDLAPGVSDTFTYTYLVTQSDLDNGSIYNIADASGYDPNNVEINDSDEVTVTAIQNPSIALDKSADVADYDSVNDPIEYTFIVSNTGNVTLTNVTVDDPLFSLNFGPVDLAPGVSDTFIYTYLVTQSDLDNGSIYNIADASGFDPNNVEINDSDDETVTAIQNPSIALDKSADVADYDAVNDPIEYTFIVSNTGNVTLTNVTVDDPLFSLNFGPVDLAPGVSDTFTYTYLVTQSDLDNGSIYNMADANGFDPNNVEINDSDDETVTAIQNPSIALDKSADVADYDAVNDPIEYTFIVSNTGNVTLTNVTVDDPLFSLNFGPVDLAPGVSDTFTYTYLVTQSDLDNGSIYNLADASGYDPNNVEINDSDDETVTAIQNPSIALDKSANVADYDAVNDPIEYTFIVSNTGNVTLTNVTVEDPLFSLNFGPVDLAPGVSDTFTYTYLVTQTDLDNSSIYNIADASGYDPNNVEIIDSDEETVTAIQNPSIALDKSADVADYDAVNDPIEYTFIVSNTGNVTLTNVTVDDPLFSLNFGPVDLAPGLSDTFTYTYLVTQSDLDNGSIYNIANASGFDPNDVEINDSDDETVMAIQNPSIALDKSADVSDYDAVNDPIEYTFIISNTGNVTLTNVTVDDPLFSLNFGPVDLAPGVSDTFTYTYLITQSDLDNGSIYNIADASGYDPNNVEINDSDEETVTAIQNPSIALDKSADVSDYDAVNDPIEYTFIVSNTGNVTLTNVSVEDPLFSLNFGPVDLAPGVSDTFTYTYLVTQSDLDNGSIYNIAEASGYDPNNVEINDSDEETVTAIQNPSIALDKSADVANYDAVNDPIEYTFIVSNTGNVTLTNVTVDDPLFSLNFGPVDLAPGVSDTFTYTYLVTQSDLDNGSIYNVADANGFDPNDVEINDSDDETVTAIQNPSIALDKSADVGDYDAVNDPIEYTFIVSNTGNVTLTNVTVDDPLFSLIFGPVDLAPGVSDTFTYTYLVTQSDLDNGNIYNIAEASGFDPNNVEINDSDDETVTAIQNPSIALDKSADVSDYDAVNDPIEYTFIVSNTGNVTLTNVTVDDPLFSLNFGPVDLAPGVSDTFTYTYLVTQSDLDNGSIYNIADANGFDPNNVEINDSDDETVTAIQNPSIALDKSADVADYDAVNDPIEYTFIVSNTGNVTLTNVTVDDPLFSLNFGPVDLAPGVSDTFTYTYLVTQTDLDNGSIYNIAEASGYDPNDIEINDSDDETVTAIQNPSIALDKSADVADYDAVNDPIEYTFIISNTGNVTLTNVTVDDPLFSLIFGPVDLAPGVSDTFIYTYLVTQSDLDNGSIYNVADASGFDPNNVEINDSDEETVTAIQNPSIALDKSADVADYDAVNDPIEYTFIVSNTGNVTLTNVTVDDPLFSLNFGPVDLAPGVSDTFTYTYLVTQSDLDNGSIYNIADASGFDPNNVEINDSDDETVTAIQNPSIALDKSADVSDYDAVNDPIEYTFIVSNMGNVTLTNVTVDDPLFSLNFGPVDLAPGVSDTFIYTYLVTQSDLDNGSIYNLADASGFDPNNVEINDSDDETVTAIQNPSIALDKSADVADYDAVNDPIEYTFIVSNTGNVTLTNVTVDDPLFSLNFGPVDLAPGVSDTFTYTYLVTQSDLDNGSIYNLADASGYDLNNVEINDSDDETVTAIQNPSISFEKSTNVSTYDSVGDQVIYTFIVTNTGNVTLTNVTFSDPLFSLNYGPITLLPSSSQTYTYTHSITQQNIDNGSIYNLATASGYDPNDIEFEDTDEVTVTAIQNPDITLVKSTNVSTYDNVGDQVIYTFTVTNTGNVTLTNVTVSDTLFSLNYGPITLSPSSSQTYTYTHSITQQNIDNGSIYNLATASGYDPNDIEFEDTDEVTVTAIQNPDITLVKSTNVSTYDAVGDQVIYTFTVTNTGNVTLTNVTVSDPLFSLNYGPITLLPSSSQTYTYTHSITQANLNNGSIYNVATVSGYDPNDVEFEDTDEVTVTAIQNPDITLVKSSNVSTYDAVGDQVIYTFTVTNTGNVTLTNVTVSDPLFSLNYGPITLLPSSSQTYTYTHTITQANLNNGSIYNVATARGYDPNNVQINDTDDVTVTAIQNPNLTLLKEGVFDDNNMDGFAQPGETMTFTFQVTNTGNVTIYNAVIQDAVIGVSNLVVTPSTLIPGATGTAMATYAITAADINEGGKYNVAQVNGRTLTNQIVTRYSNDPTALDPEDDRYDENCPNCTYVDLNRPASIADRVWHDLNGNGVQNTGEPGISGVNVHLYQADGLYMGTRQTDVNGLYLFEVVPAGNYQLRFEIPTGFTPTQQNIGNDLLDSDINSQGLTAVFTVDSEETVTHIDAGFYRCAKIGEWVWYDSNKNDMADPVENGINGLVVKLWRNQNGSWVEWAQTTTAHKPGTPSDDGFWQFCVAPGQYYVQIVMPPLGLVRVRPNMGQNELTDSDLTNENGILTTASFTVMSGTDRLDIGAGFYPMAVAGNRIWVDANHDGIQNTNEPPVAGVVVTARDVTNGQVLRSAISDHQGIYELDYLETKDVYLQFSLPSTHQNYLPTTAKVGSDLVNSDVDGSFGPMTTRAFTFESGEVNENIDLGIVNAVLPVEWGRIYALKTENGHLVRWSTYQEFNSDHFVVEGKGPGQNTFTVLSKSIPAKGISTGESWYEWTNENVSTPGIYYYRVRQLDKDNKFTLSQEVHVTSDEDIRVEIYPNPSVDETTFELYSDREVPVSITIWDNDGRLIKQVSTGEWITRGIFQKTIQWHGIPAGAYNVVILAGDTKIEKRLIIMAR